MISELKEYDELMEFHVRRLCDMIKCDTEDEYQAARRDITASRLAMSKLQYDRLHRPLTKKEVLDIYSRRGKQLVREVALHHGVSHMIVRSIWNKWTYKRILKGKK